MYTLPGRVELTLPGRVQQEGYNARHILCYNVQDQKSMGP